MNAPKQEPPNAPPALRDHATLTPRGDDLLRQTVRMIAILVGVCVVFVGALSVVAVAVASRAVGAGAAEARTPESKPADKKPLSI